MSIIEIFWSRIAVLANDPRQWDQLPLQFQQQIVNAYNLVANVLDNPHVKVNNEVV